MAYIQLSLFGKTLWEHFYQMTSWTLEPCYSRFQRPKFQFLILKLGQTPVWCEGVQLTSAGGFWMPSIGENPPSHSAENASSSWQILQANVPRKYYLSPAVCSRILRLAQITGCPPPEPVEHLLLKQGGKYPSSNPFRNGVCGVRRSPETAPHSSAASDGCTNPSQLCLPEHPMPSPSGMREKNKTD